MKHNPAFLLAGALFLGSAFHAFAADTKVVVAYTGASDFAAAFVAKDKGIFQRNGLDVDLQIMANGGVATAAVTSGSAQFGGLTPSVLLPGVANGLDLVVAAGAQVTPTASKVGLLAGPGQDGSQKGAFAGKTIGVPGLNGALHVLARKWLAERGEDVSAVNFVEIAFGQMPDALKSKQVDFVVTADPFYGRAVSANVGTPAGDVLSTMPADTLMSLYAASRGWAEANPDAIKAFTISLDEAYAEIVKDPAVARGAIANYVKLPPELLETLPIPTLKATVTPSQIAPWVDVSLEQQIITTKIDPATLVVK